MTDDQLLLILCYNEISDTLECSSHEDGFGYFEDVVFGGSFGMAIETIVFSNFERFQDEYGGVENELFPTEVDITQWFDMGLKFLDECSDKDIWRLLGRIKEDR